MTTKYQLAIQKNANVHTFAEGPAPAGVKVVAQAAGPVSTLDKVKQYYKGLIAAIGSILVIANELTPVLNFLPGQDKQYVTVAIGVLTTVSVFLTSNQHWVDDL